MLTLGVVAGSELFGYPLRVCYGLGVRSCYELDHRLIDDVRVSVIADILWG